MHVRVAIFHNAPPLIGLSRIQRNAIHSTRFRQTELLIQVRLNGRDHGGEGSVTWARTGSGPEHGLRTVTATRGLREPHRSTVAGGLEACIPLPFASARAPECPGERQRRRSHVEAMAMGELAGRDHYVVLAPIAAERDTLAQALEHR